MLLVFTILQLLSIHNAYASSYFPQWVRDTASSTSQKAFEAWTTARDYFTSSMQSLKNRVNSWNTATKLTVLAVLLSSLMYIGYNKETIQNKVTEMLTDLEAAYKAGTFQRASDWAREDFLRKITELNIKKSPTQ